MAQPNLKVILDWANEGSTPDLVDLSAQVTQTSIRRGRNIIQDLYEVGRASFRVIDPNGDFNPQNTSSPYYGKLIPLRKVSIYGTYNSVDYALFTGYTVTYDYTYPTGQEIGYVTIKCEDAFRLFNLASVTTVTGASAGQTTGARIGKILDQIGWSATERDIDTGLSTCVADPGTTRTALAALRDVEFTEGLGAFYMSPDGKATFRNRQNTIIGYAPRTTNTNYLWNPSFEYADNPTLGWGAQNSNISVVSYTADAYMGGKSVILTRITGSGTVGVGVTCNRVLGARPSITAGDVLNISGYFKRITGTPNFRIDIAYYTSLTATVPVQVVNGTAVTGSTSWTKVSQSFTVPSGLSITHADIRFCFGNTGAAGQQMLVDAVVMEKNNTTSTPYPFDGESSLFPTNYAANTSWLGTPYRSASLVSYLIYPDPTYFSQTSPGITYSGIQFALDDKLLVNSATFTRTGGTAQTYTDSNSVATYFLHSINRSNLLMQTDALALDLARAYVAGRQDTAIRIENFILDLNQINYATGIEAAISLDYFDKVEISNIQPGGSSITQTLFIQGVGHDITPNSWKTTLSTYESLLDGLVLNDSVKGTLDYNVLGY